MCTRGGDEETGQEAEKENGDRMMGHLGAEGKSQDAAEEDCPVIIKYKVFNIGKTGTSCYLIVYQLINYFGVL